MEKNKQKGQKVAFYTLGCKVNQYETNAMIQQFLKKGYEIVEFDQYADVYVINTCTVTNMSDRKSRQNIRKAKVLNPTCIVIAVGCYAQVAKEELEEMKEIDLILGNNEKNNITAYVEEYKKQKEKEKVISDVMHQKEFCDFGEVLYTEKSRAVIKIQDGCDRFCSYCIIPYARGRVRSRKIENVIKEITNIVQSGIKEVVITGIHIASYGKDFEEDISLIHLLEQINQIEGLKRIRLGSLEPTLITKEFVKRLSKLDKICNHFHLSLQSGCNETLKRMNRNYTTKEFEVGVNLLRKHFKEVLLTTDSIVGFPGETKEEFELTYQFLEKIKFYKMHVFKFSGRKGTKAYQMKNQIDGKVKEQRSEKLIQLSQQNEKEYNKLYVGKKVEVLIEEEENGYFKGHTPNYMMIKIEKEDKKIEEIQNKIVEVCIIKSESVDLVAVF